MRDPHGRRKDDELVEPLFAALREEAESSPPPARSGFFVPGVALAIGIVALVWLWS